MSECPACSGEGDEMGKLGLILWQRCRACGMEFSQRVSKAPGLVIGQTYTYEQIKAEWGGHFANDIELPVSIQAYVDKGALKKVKGGWECIG